MLNTSPFRFPVTLSYQQHVLLWTFLPPDAYCGNVPAALMVYNPLILTDTLTSDRRLASILLSSRGCISHQHKRHVGGPLLPGPSSTKAAYNAVSSSGSWPAGSKPYRDSRCRKWHRARSRLHNEPPHNI